MGLFSKFFSKDDEPAAVEAPDGKHEPAANETSTAGRVEPGEPVARAATAEPEAMRPAVDKAVDLPPSEERTAVMQPAMLAAAVAAAAAPAPRPEAAPEQSAKGREPNVVFETDAPTTRLDRSAVASKLDGKAAAAAPPNTKASPSATRTLIGVPPPLAGKPVAKASPPAPRAEPAKPAAAAPASAARVPAAPPARKEASSSRATGEQAAARKRSPKHTPPMFRTPVAPEALERAVDRKSTAQRLSDRPIAAEVDAAVDTLLQAAAPPQQPSKSDEAADRRAVAETFAAMAKVHAQPLRDFMFQVSLGGAPRQWAAACRAVLSPLLDGSKQIGLDELCGVLTAFDAALERAASEPSASIGEASSAALQAAYARLHGHMPEAFAAIVPANGGRMVLLESLLLQVPALHRRTLGKLYAAGLSSLPQLSQAKPEELAVVTGIDRELADRVIEHVRRFERERSRIDPTAMRSHLFERLRALIARLERLQADFERAEQDDASTRKRAARRGREAAVLELEVLLAELGDLSLIEELKRCSVRSKIKRVENYLQQHASA